MKLSKIVILAVTLIGILSARNIKNVDYYHPKSEPKGLYIVDFKYENRYFQYRVYCPTGDVRNITNDRWGKARKAYQEDRIKFDSIRVVREAFDYICE